MSDTASSSILSHRIALIAGAGSGIGEAAAKLMASHGVGVIVGDVNQAASQRVAEGIRAKGGQAMPFPLDVGNEAAWQTLEDSLQEPWNAWDILVNSAGISFGQSISDMTLADWHRVHTVNLDGIFLGLRTALRHLSKMSRPGVVISLSSVSGLIPFPSASAYASSKAAVIQLSRVAARECEEAGNGVRVVTLAPGGVKTPMWRTMPFFQELAKQGEEVAWKQLDPEGSFLEAEDLANAVHEVVVNAPAHPNGQTWILDKKGASGQKISLDDPSWIP